MTGPVLRVVRVAIRAALAGMVVFSIVADDWVGAVVGLAALAVSVWLLSNRALSMSDGEPRL